MQYTNLLNKLVHNDYVLTGKKLSFTLENNCFPMMTTNFINFKKLLMGLFKSDELWEMTKSFETADFPFNIKTLRDGTFQLTRTYKDDKFILNGVFYQSRAEAVEGITINVCVFALIVNLLCLKFSKDVVYKPGKLKYIMGEVFVLPMNVDSCKKQTQLLPFDFPQLRISNFDINKRFYVDRDDIEIVNYKYH